MYIFFLAERKHHCDSFHSVHLFATKRSRSPTDICTVYQQADGIDGLFSNVPFRNSAFVWTRLEFKKQIVNVYLDKLLERDDHESRTYVGSVGQKLIRVADGYRFVWGKLYKKMKIYYPLLQLTAALAVTHELLPIVELRR